MEKLELQTLRDIPIEGVAERLGLRVERHKALCPFHADNHPSLSFSTHKNTCRCFVCMDRSLGTIDLVMRHLSLGFREACRWLADGSPVLTLPNREPAEGQRREKAYTFDPKRYERFFQRPWLSDEARRFLFDERRLDPRVVRWCRLSSWRDRNGVNWLQIPYYDMEGHLIGIQNRNLDYKKPTPSPSPSPLSLSTPSPLSSPSPPPTPSPTKKASPEGGGLEGASEGASGATRFRFPYGSRCSIYNLPVLKLLRPGEELYITEGCSDCWAMLSAGHKAIAIPSATLLSPRDKDILASLAQPPLEDDGSEAQATRTFHMYPDQDAPGELLFRQLHELLPTLQHHHLPPGCKDFADYYRLQS